LLPQSSICKDGGKEGKEVNLLLWQYISNNELFAFKEGKEVNRLKLQYSDRKLVGKGGNEVNKLFEQ
jgi:hypothetical protein